MSVFESPLPLAAILFGLFWLAAVLVRARGTLELRTRLLEMFALATSRGLPLTPLASRAADEQSGRRKLRVARIHRELDRGGSLTDACAAAGRGLFPGHLIGAIRSAEGSAALPRALEAAARDAAGSQMLRHRLLVVALYPALVGVALLFVLQPVVRWIPDSLEIAEPASLRLVPVVAWSVIGALAVVALLWQALRRLCLLPGARLLASQRLLRALAPHLDAGEPLPMALRRAAPACGNRAMAAGARDAAAELEAGMGWHDAVGCMPVPRFVRDRLRGGDPAGMLPGLADECARRYGARVDRLFRWAHPLALLVLGVLAAMHFAGLMEILDRTREIALW